MAKLREGDGLSPNMYVSAFVGGAVADHGALIIYDISTYAGLVSSVASTLHIVKILLVERYFCPRRTSLNLLQRFQVPSFHPIVVNPHLRDRLYKQTRESSGHTTSSSTCTHACRINTWCDPIYRDKEALTLTLSSIARSLRDSTSYLNTTYSFSFP